MTRRWNRDWNWTAVNKNDETDVTIANKLPATEVILAALMRNEELRQRHERRYELDRRHIAAVKRKNANSFSA